MEIIRRRLLLVLFQTTKKLKKFTEWGIVGHNGIDYGLPEGTELIASADGKVIQSGDNGDFGISVTIQHSWGQSLYAHLKESKVSQDQEVKAGDLIGLSGQTGSAFGEHLHFAVKPNDADANNGYLGFIDPRHTLENQKKNQWNHQHQKFNQLKYPNRLYPPTCPPKRQRRWNPNEGGLISRTSNY